MHQIIKLEVSAGGYLMMKTENTNTMKWKTLFIIIDCHLHGIAAGIFVLPLYLVQYANFLIKINGVRNVRGRGGLAWGVKVNRIMSLPKDVYILIPAAHEYLTLHGKRVSADVIILRTLTWDDYPGGPNGIPWVPIRKRRRSSALKMPCYWLWTWRKEFIHSMSQRMQVTSRSWENQGNRLSPGAFRRSGACWHLDFSPVKCTVAFWPPES